MKTIGIILISIGIALSLFVVYFFVKEQDRLVSPIPDESGVKVIFITPSP